ncbi:MAG: potassium-transporting ATPase potassium-binding subunit [Acidimicrobiaceae bacterium]|nr:potassium-transporting ATPase potassium-binding subunit [Acidimicrobiaceae bacterium]
MSAAAWVQLAVLVALLAITTPMLGAYLAKVFGDGPAPGDRVFGPVERLLYRVAGVDERSEQRWPVYARALLAFSAVSVVFLYGLTRLQAHLPLNPSHATAMSPALGFNTAVSFVTNTNWQNYAGEASASHLLQTLGLVVQNFASAAVGLAVAVAVIRGLVRRRSATIGNFWVDLTRGVMRVLLPLSFVLAVVFVSQGVVQNLHGFRSAHTIAGATQQIPGGPIASQEAIKELGTNGGGPYNANSAHPFENPNPVTNLLQIWALLAVPFALTFAFGRMARDRRQGRVVFAAMFTLWIASALLAMQFETHGTPKLSALGADQRAVATQSGGNMEGKETRFGPAASGLFAASTTGTSTGSVIATHDSLTPGGGGVALAHIMLGEVSPGGVGAGLYGMLIFALLSVFIAGLMVGRTPEYLGKKIQAAEMKLVVLYIIAVPVVVLGFAGTSVLLRTALGSTANPGPHGLSEITYAFASAGNNNGSAFGGLAGNTDWYNTTLGLSMLVGRFLLIVPALAIAGSLGRKQTVPPSAGTFPTGTPLFTGLLVGVVVIVVGLTYFPVLALGPLVEHLGL